MKDGTDAKTYIEEVIREKSFIALWDEIPYTISVTVTEITPRTDDTTYIKGIIYTKSERYRKMIIGKKGSIIKEIGTMARKDLSGATGRKIFLELTVEVR